MLRVSVNRRCAAPPEQVWPWIAEPHRHVQTLPDSVSKIEVSDDGDVACVVTAMGVSEPMIVRVVEAVEPQSIADRTVTPRQLLRSAGRGSRAAGAAPFRRAP